LIPLRIYDAARCSTDRGPVLVGNGLFPVTKSSVQVLVRKCSARSNWPNPKSLVQIGLGIAATPAMGALGYSGLPDWNATGLPDPEEFEPYIHHFPDGNASIARLLLRGMIPAAARIACRRVSACSPVTTR
jgi:hypothetical protein